ncbi:TolC family protein [Proteiniphilum sp.]|uniref:TolC family protein n=1 Tax=Proteiniphilum sp. TaxID=1926877 RepID=UPI002B209537|nr:TolC family protein [Proteiniphilum sp.]MEA4916352.1 TolC family protein [Proteiniphilum sp.]MEA4950948.1 TolC family protein [Petrimonas sp.]
MKLKYVIYIFLTGVFFSCSIGKNYQRPNLDLPGTFRNNALVEMEKDTVIHPPHGFFRNIGLLALLDTAFLRNSDLLVAVKNIESAAWSLKAAKLDFFPEINARLNGTYNRASENSAIGQTGQELSSEDYNLSAALTWDVDIWGKIRRGKEEAVSNYLQTSEARKAVQTKLVFDIAQGYYNLLMLDEQLDIAVRSRELTDSTLFIVRLQYEVNDANLLGIKQIEAQLQQNNLLISQIEQSIFAQENALSLLCGNYAGHIERSWDKEDEFHKIPPEGYPASVLIARPDIRAAELALRAANARVGIAQASMFPALNISLTGGLNSLTTSDWFSTPASLFGTVAGGLVQPVFNRGRLKANYEQAKIEREKAVVNFRQKVLEGYSQVSDALQNRMENENQYTFALKREEALEEGVRSANIMFKAGVANYLDVISVQSNYLQARLETTRLYTNKALSNVEVYYSLGGGWE